MTEENNLQFLKDFYFRSIGLGIESVIVNNFKYKVVDDKIILLSYRGVSCDILEVPDWFEEIQDDADDEEAPDCKVKEVVFGERLKRVGKSAFCLWPDLEVVVAPGVVDVEELAFTNLSMLMKVDMPMLENVGDKAFCECMSLCELNSKNIKSLGMRAFFNTAIKEINLSNLKHAEVECFAYCERLRRVKLPLYWRDAPEGMFLGNKNLESVNAEVLMVIPKRFFLNCVRLRFIHIQASQVAISAFAGCSNLNSLKIGNEVVQVNTSIFHWHTNTLDDRMIPSYQFCEMLKEKSKTLYQRHIENLKKGKFKY